MSWSEIQEILFYVRAICPVQAISIEVHDHGLKVAERYGYAVYDAMIIASALVAGCTTLYSEDMQNGQVIDDKLSILNPFI
jgi:predicted nucleic acid-binding protein